MSDELFSRILGCMVGNAIGDAFGGVVEFRTADKVKEIVGGQWVDKYLPYPADREPNALGIWQQSPPRGTGTDDTRNNQIFVECVIRNQGKINSHFLAIEYIERYRDREKFYPRYADFAEKQYRWEYERSCAYLGMHEPPSGLPIWVTPWGGFDFPMLRGLISLAPAGLLFKGEPDKAYMKAYELAFTDVGYAKDATAMMAAMISAALGGNISGKEIIKVGLETNPFHFDRRIMVQWLEKFLRLADEAANDQELINALSREIQSFHPFDTIEVLGVPMAVIYYSDGDPVRSIIMAANDRDLNENGSLKRLRDVDCTGGVAGALVGAFRGSKAFPQDWVGDTIKANKEVYGIDLELNASRFCEAVYGIFP